MRETRAEINLENLRHNFNTVRNLADGSKIMAIVKANAYGHGITRCSKELESYGADWFGVAFPEEAVEMRKAGIEKPILVLVPAPPEDSYLYCEYDLDTIISSVEQANILSETGLRKGKKISAHLFINTGMNRDGIHSGAAMEAAEIISGKMKGLELKGLCTHFGSADNPDSSMTTRQLETFDTTLQLLKKNGFEFPEIHTANSAAMMNYPESHYSMVRPGISLYGYDTSNDNSKETVLKPVMNFKTKVILTRHLARGGTVGYGERYIADKNTNIAILPVGYGDGYLWSLTNKGNVVIKGKKYPVIGTVCMDQTIIDIGNDDVNPGDDVLLIGSDEGAKNDAGDIARMVGTISYEVLSLVTRRVPRIY